MVGYGRAGEDRETCFQAMLTDTRLQSLIFGTSTGYGAFSSAPCSERFSEPWYMTS